MNTNMTGIRCFSKILPSLLFGRNSLSIGRVSGYELEEVQLKMYSAGI